MIINAGVITHKHGTDVYTSTTEDGLYRLLAAYCRDWWDDTEIDGSAPEDNRECVRMYFESSAIQDTESLTITPALLED